jgi:predicted TIM-barrel fold metal-dependent hydrolase
MLTRREALFAAVAAAATRLRLNVPKGACDCHTHIFGDPQRFPMVAGRTYTPAPAPVAELQALHRALHMDRVVIVQPSVYGTDNSCLLDAIRQLGSRARGVAVIDDQTTDAALAEMDRAGVRGIRINLATAGQNDPAAAGQRLQAAVERVKGRHWHIQIYAQLPVIAAVREQVMASPVPVVFDHFGAAQAALGVGQPGFDALLNMVRAGKAYVKISAPYRSSTQSPDYADVAPLAKALVAANHRCILWATDWPHPDSSRVEGRKPTDIAPRYQIDDGRVFNLLAGWAPDAAVRKTILVENPKRLYGY